MADQSTRWPSLRWFPAVLSLSYLVVCSLYILLSDRLLGLAVNDPARLTRLQMYKGWAFVAVSAGLIFLVTRHFVRSIRRVEHSLASAKLDYRRLLETTREGVLITDGAGRAVFANERLCQLAGVSHERLMRSGFEGLAEPAGPAGGGTQASDEVRIVRPDGTEVWAIVSETPVLGHEGPSGGTLRLFTDNTARRKAADELAESLQMQRLLLSELDHRVRNNLASLVGMVELSAGDRPELRQFARKVTGRIRVMAAAHSLLSDGRWTPVPLGAIVSEITAPAEERRLMEGPPVAVCMEQVLPLMLVLHELFANAQEYGALSRPNGVLEIRWAAADEGNAGREGQVRLEWRERDGPVIEVSPEPGFGMAVARGLAGSELRGSLEYRFSREGLVATLRWSGHGGHAGPTPARPAPAAAARTGAPRPA